MAKNRINRKDVGEIGLTDVDLIAQVKATLAIADDASQVPTNNVPINRIERDLPGSMPSPVLDRFGQRYGVSSEDAGKRAFKEPVALLAREMMLTELTELCQFRLEPHNDRHSTEQLMHLHGELHPPFEDLCGRCQQWLDEVVDASFITRFTFNSALSFREIHEGSEAARAASRQWQAESRRFVSLGKVENFLPRAEPFRVETFASTTVEEDYVLLCEFWGQACTLLAEAIMRVVSNGVEQGPFKFGREDALFDLVKVDERTRKGVYSYFTREVRRERDEQTKRTVHKKGTNSQFPDHRIERRTTTENQRQTLSRVHHTHALTEVQWHGSVDALATPSLAIPPAIEAAMSGAPPCIRPFLDVLSGSLVLQRTVAQELEVDEKTLKTTVRDHPIPRTVRRSARYSRLDAHLDPALCLFRTFVLAGWGPAEMTLELKRRSQVRTLQSRKRESARKKGRVKTRYEEEFAKQLAKGSPEARRLLASGVTAVSLLTTTAVFFTFVENPHLFLVSLAGVLATGAYVPFKYLRSRRVKKQAIRKNARWEMAHLESAEQHLATEIETLRETPIAERRS